MLRSPKFLLSALISGSLMMTLSACGGGPGGDSDGGEEAMNTDGDGVKGGKNSTDKKKDEPEPDKNKPKPDIPGIEEEGEKKKKEGNPDCEGSDRDCFPIDLLFVIDNSGTMAEEQMNLARNFGKLIDQLKNLKLSNGKPARPLVNLYVTTTDMDHPLCKAFHPDGYKPQQGKPVFDTCLERISDFTALGKDAKKYDEACTEFCSDKSLKPKGNFISFGPGGKNSNVPGDKIAEALSCIGPQGVNGCGFEAPLESMLQALRPDAPWNTDKKRPFLRKNAILAVAIVTDEADCSVRAPEGFDYFTEKDDYWETDPEDKKTKKWSSAVCWNAGVECEGETDGVYKNCKSVDKKVLHPLTRYTGYFDHLKSKYNKEIVMLGILGVPKVKEHNEKAPFEPTKGGVFDLEYRNWKESDILPEDKGATVAKKQFDFGIGPGCTGKGTGQAIPPVRIKEVCEHLNEYDDKGKIKRTRCCIESICDNDFSSAIRCLSGLLEVVDPPK